MSKSLAVLKELGSLSGVTLAEITYRNKGDKTLAKHTFRLGASLEKMYADDIKTIEAMLPSLSGMDYDAAIEILKSLQESLQVGIGNNSAYTCAGVYVQLEDAQSCDVHATTGALYVLGESIGREVIEVGEPKKPVKSAAITIAKNKIRHNLKSDKIRRFKLTNVASVAIYGEKVVIVEEDSK